MKILNLTTNEPIISVQTTPISGLEETTSPTQKSLLHIAVESPDNNGYTSKKITFGDFSNKVFTSVDNLFKRDYWDYHDLINGKSIDRSVKKSSLDYTDEFHKKMIEFLIDDGKTYLPDISEEDSLWSENSIEPNDEIYKYIPKESFDFVKHITYDFQTILGYIDKNNDMFKSKLGEIDKTIKNLDCYFNSEMTITTSNEYGTTNTSVNHNKTENDDYCQMAIKDGNKISNEWVVPASGNLVIYGWLDSSSALNNKSLPSAYCVIEADINGTTSTDETGTGVIRIPNWEIISVQPVIPAKTLTYVGFNLLVHKGLTIRVRTGFNVGAKSYTTSNEQDGFDTLSNITPNGFKCQVFSNINYDRNLDIK